MNEGNAETRLFGLEKNYTTFQVNHEKILKLEDLDKSHPYFTSGLYDLVEDSFYDEKGEFRNFLKTIKAKDAAPGTSNSNAALVSPSSVQSTNVSFQSLPKIDLSKFSGKFSGWENFRGVFRSIIHFRKDLLPIMKLHYLRTLLIGEALGKIKSFPITNDNYD